MASSPAGLDEVQLVGGDGDGETCVTTQVLSPRWLPMLSTIRVEPPSTWCPRWLTSVVQDDDIVGSARMMADKTEMMLDSV